MYFFANFGLPEEIVSDNGPQFSSQDFELFCVNNGIKHTSTPPYHPVINGAAERAVQMVKQAMARMAKDLPLRQRLTKFLLTYRTTPHELLVHRRVRTLLTLVMGQQWTNIS